MSKVIDTFLKKWGTVLLFVAGLVFIAIGAILFNRMLGFAVIGIELASAAYILDKELDKEGD